MRRILWPLIGLIAVGALFFPWANLPPLANLLLYPSSPLHLSYQSEDQKISNTDYPGLEIHYDDRGVPHIFAKDQEAMAYGMGYVHARDRSFQLEMLRRTVSGRLSEVVGARALPRDRWWAKFDFDSIAQVQWEEMQRQDPALSAVFKAYARGFNHQINSLQAGEKPLEFHLLGFEPSPMLDYAPIMLVRYMDYVLSYGENDLKFSALRRYLPDSLVEFYFPWQPPYAQFPIYPELSASDSLFPAHQNAKPGFLGIPSEADFIGAKVRRSDRNEVGSNNWAVAASKSNTGHAFLCNDTHLGLDLPGTWYEVHQVVAGEVYHGMSIPGAPYIISGFSQNLAWGMTNATWDLVDFHQLETNDEGEYRLDGQWEKLERKRVRIPVKGARPYEFEYAQSYFGPVDSLHGVPLATRWVAQASGSSEMKAFYQLYQAEDIDDGYAALQHFGHPPQNFVLADRSGQIGMLTAGYALVHPDMRRGILPGTQRQDRAAFVHQGSSLKVLRPEKGWNHSANQQQLSDDSLSPRLNTIYAPTARGRRISQMLSEKEQIDRRYLKQMHNDVLDAEWPLLKELLVETAPPAARRYLQNWEGYCSEESVAATLYNAFKWELHTQFSQRLLGDFDFGPPTEHFFWLLSQRESLPLAEGRVEKSELCQVAWDSCLQNLSDQFGPEMENWRYGRYHQIHMRHIARIEAFSREPFAAKGSPRSIRVSSNLPATHGPSKRILVEMAPDGPIAETVLAGGQSGQPGHPHYQDQVESWYAGDYYPVHWLSDPAQGNWQQSIKFE